MSNPTEQLDPFDKFYSGRRDEEIACGGVRPSIAILGEADFAELQVAIQMKYGLAWPDAPLESFTYDDITVYRSASQWRGAMFAFREV